MASVCSPGKLEVSLHPNATLCVKAFEKQDAIPSGPREGVRERASRLGLGSLEQLRVGRATLESEGSSPRAPGSRGEDETSLRLRRMDA